MKLFFVRNQYGISFHLKLFKWTFRLFKISNGIHNNPYLDYFLKQKGNKILDRKSLNTVLSLITKRYEVIEYSPGELIVAMPFANDVEKLLVPTFLIQNKPIFVEPKWSDMIFYNGKWIIEECFNARR